MQVHPAKSRPLEAWDLGSTRGFVMGASASLVMFLINLLFHFFIRKIRI